MDPLDDVAFLARSSCRVAVLDALAGGPRSRDELLASTDAARVTLDRNLNDLEERGWIDRSDGTYEPTARGAIVAAEVGRVRDRIDPGGDPGDSAADAPAETPLDEVEFLARSSSRFEVLDAIRTTPRTRGDLREAVDVSRASLSRILGELDERGYVDRTNHRCEATARGREVADACSQLRSNLAAADRLKPVLGWLPTEEFDFELGCLGDAETVLADWDDPTKSIHRVAELVRDADHVRAVSPGATREVAAAVRELTVERGGTFEGIVDARAIETVRDDDVLREHFRAMLESGRATVARHEGDLPFFVVVIVDDTVVVCGSEGDEPAHEAVETDDRRVREWAESYFESLRSEVDPVDVETFTE